ncbi:hypothetical protein DESC_310049 [Desulfosarcina cetonica]|nr:hypothetical protein DESC_310049 [Desulfosarcina cetonica]
MNPNDALISHHIRETRNRRHVESLKKRMSTLGGEVDPGDPDRGEQNYEKQQAAVIEKQRHDFS